MRKRNGFSHSLLNVRRGGPGTALDCLFLKLMKIEQIIEKKEEMLSICTYFGIGKQDAQDIIQSFFLYLLETQIKEGNLDRFEWNGQPNRSYIFVSIRNKCLKLLKEKKRTRQINSLEYKMPDTASRELKAAGEDLRNAADSCLNEQTPYNAKMFAVYYDMGHSIRSLAAATGISTTSIYVTLSHVKNKLRATMHPYRAKYKEAKNE